VALARAFAAEALIVAGRTDEMREHEHDNTNYVVGTLVDNMP